jgi:hypothetical protein
MTQTPVRAAALLTALFASVLQTTTLPAQTTPASGSPENDVAASRGTSVAPAPARSAPAVRVALQAGHWLAAEAPDELASLRTNGTRGGGKAEWEVTLDIARRTATLLEARGYHVDVLPATVPPGYRADLFIAIHADGHDDPSASGFSVGTPRRDATGLARDFASLLAQSYREATALRHRPETRRMQGYYAFNYRRYRHALDPMTVGVIIETGFLTSPSDRNILLGAPDRSARGIAEAVERYLPLADTDRVATGQPGG